MRIISAFVALLLAAALGLFAQTALAAEDAESNETKINLKIQDSGVIETVVTAESASIMLAYNPNDFTDILPPKSEEELKREKALARFEEKRRVAKLPEGKFTINASAYTAAADECGKSDGITASGLMVKEKETIACPPQFPFGTKLKIEGMGTYVCQDRGGAIKGNHIDIYMKTKSQAFSFGRKNLLAEVVN